MIKGKVGKLEAVRPDASMTGLCFTISASSAAAQDNSPSSTWLVSVDAVFGLGGKHSSNFIGTMSLER